MKKSLYLANPYGFSAQQRGGPLPELVRALESVGADVWEPFAHNNQIDRASTGWAYRIGQSDLRDVHEADGLFAVVNGCPPDEGVMVELGLAIAWEGRCSCSETIFAGAPTARTIRSIWCCSPACLRPAGKLRGTARSRRSLIPARRSHAGCGMTGRPARRRPRRLRAYSHRVAFVVAMTWQVFG